MKDIQRIIEICVGMLLCLICAGSHVSFSAMKTGGNTPSPYFSRSIGTILGALFAGVTLDHFGRRKLMIFSGLWVLFTIDCLTWLSPNIYFYLHGLSRFGYGMIFVIYIVYISETVCAKYRGFAVSLNCAARAFSGSIVAVLYSSEYSHYHWPEMIAFIILVVLALTGLICMWVYNPETHVFMIQKNKANNDEVQSIPNPTIDQDVEEVVEPSNQEIESNSHNTELLENNLLSKSNVLTEHALKVYLKTVLLILTFRLPLLIVQSLVYNEIITISRFRVAYDHFYILLLLIRVSILVTAGYKTGTTYRRKSIFLANISLISLLLFVIGVLVYLQIHHKITIVSSFIVCMFSIAQIVSSAGLFHCSDLLLADFLPLKFRSLNVAIIFCIEHLLDFLLINLTGLMINGTVVVFSLAIICAISGVVMYFKFDSLYDIYRK